MGEVASIDIISYHHIAFEDFLNHKAKTTRQLSRQHCWVGIEKSETEIPITKASASPSIKITHFLLAWGSTVHKVQSLSLDQSAVDFDSKKQKSFRPSQIYTALSKA